MFLIVDSIHPRPQGAGFSAMFSIKSMKSMPKIICWDLDDTLGIFSALESSSGIFQVRPGIPELLQQCRDWGITNVLTTNASSAYASLALERGRLARYFATVFDRQQVMAWEGKKYREVSKKYQLGWRPGRYMLVIGDSSKDMSCDMKGLPFILDATNPSPPTALEFLIQELCTKESYFTTTFRKLYQQEKEKGGYRSFCAPDGQECMIGYARSWFFTDRICATPLIIVPKKEDS
jgi:hypothetical protein